MQPTLHHCTHHRLRHLLLNRRRYQRTIIMVFPPLVRFPSHALPVRIRNTFGVRWSQQAPIALLRDVLWGACNFDVLLLAIWSFLNYPLLSLLFLTSEGNACH